MKYKTEVGPDHVLLWAGWYDNVNALLFIRCKDYIGEVMPF